MKNPCTQCIVKVNCSQICFEKTNYKKLIEVALMQMRSIPAKNRTYINQQKRYLELMSETKEEERVIIIRQLKLMST